ncbi:hypothetical protein PanWU01x14_314970 [Parasponia andersonii]|uniref:Uncharacterized protein n=1 Tax=Parasponia andersonii TaxID=3476 RepID=A0A2P5ANL9_PARAD|nr:hypothetical protein PanWU01x14_314970 [Parasponia andersonii]
MGEKPKEPEKPKEKPKEPEKSKEKPKELEKPKEPEKSKPAPLAPPKDPAPAPCVAGYPPLAYPSFGTCCLECYGGHGGRPCYSGHGGPSPCYQYDGYYGRPVYDSYGGGRAYYVNRCDYFSEENSGACSIM